MQIIHKFDAFAIFTEKQKQKLAKIKIRSPF